MPRSQRRKQPEGQPEFFVDRALGRYQLVGALEELGYTVHTLASVYGEHREQHVLDEEWLADAGKNAWIVLTKDERIRRNPLEKAAVEQYRVRMFCLTSAGLTGPEQTSIIVENLNRILQRARKPGPFIWGISKSGLRMLLPAAR